MALVRAPMAGIVARVLVQPGERVAPGQEVVVLESMKMEIPLTTEVAGTVQAVRAEPGAFVNEGDALLEIET
jgi:acetyl-CoA carboxylase biotin carboxyl carrier protein